MYKPTPYVARRAGLPVGERIRGVRIAARPVSQAGTAPLANTLGLAFNEGAQVLSTEEQELLDFESSDIADYDQQESIDALRGEHADAYRTHLVAARWLDGWRERLVSRSTTRCALRREPKSNKPPYA